MLNEEKISPAPTGKAIFVLLLRPFILLA